MVQKLDMTKPWGWFRFLSDIDVMTIPTSILMGEAGEHAEQYIPEQFRKFIKVVVKSAQTTPIYPKDRPASIGWKYEPQGREIAVGITLTENVVTCLEQKLDITDPSKKRVA